MKRETKINMIKIVLMTVAAAGVISMAVVAPNALQSLDMFYGDKKRKYNPKYHLNKTIIKMKKRGLIKFKKIKGQIFLELTKKGEKELIKYQLKEAIIKKPNKWDKKWRVIIFDIKERKRYVRDELRKQLNNLGFVKLQNSVWVHPYECEEIIVMLKAYLETGKDILYMTVEKIENDRWLKEEFSLQ